MVTLQFVTSVSYIDVRIKIITSKEEFKLFSDTIQCHWMIQHETTIFIILATKINSNIYK
jgi:hypothetical protein